MSNRSIVAVLRNIAAGIVSAATVVASTGTPVLAQAVQAQSISDGPGTVDLGGGFHTWREQRSPARCINFTESAGTGASGNITQAAQVDYATVKRTLHADAGADISIGAFSLGGRTHYLRKTVETSLSASYHFLYNLRRPVKHVIPDPVQPVSALGARALAAGAADFLATCGDDYVYERVDGGLLFVTLRYEFDSIKVKEKFTQSVKVGYSVFSGSADYSSLTSSDRRSVRLSIVTYQEGGDPSQLASLVAGTSTVSSKCTIDNPKACNGMLKAIDGYARGPFNDAVKVMPAVYGYTTLPYATAGVIGAPSLGPVPLSVREARLNLQGVLEQNAGDGAQAESVLRDYAPLLDPAQQTSLNWTTTATGRNVARVDGTAEYCYQYLDPANPQNCDTQYRTMLGNLESYETAALTPPARIDVVYETSRRAGKAPNAALESYCAVPSGYVIVGVGVRIKSGNVRTTRLRMRPLSPGGILGPPEIKACGADDTPDWVDVPDGHVLTGIGLRAKEVGSTRITLWAYSRELDPMNASLKGNVFVTLGGYPPPVAAEALYVPETFGLDPNRTLVTGIGSSGDEDTVKTLYVDVSSLTRNLQ